VVVVPYLASSGGVDTVVDQGEDSIPLVVEEGIAVAVGEGNPHKVVAAQEGMPPGVAGIVPGVAGIVLGVAGIAPGVEGTAPEVGGTAPLGAA